MMPTMKPMTMVQTMFMCRLLPQAPKKVRDSTPMMMAKERTASSGTFWPVRLPVASMSVESFSV